MKVDFLYNPGPKKEDTYLIQDNIFGVFDGANGRNKFIDQKGRSGGQIASEIVRDEFSCNDQSLKKLAIAANRKMKESMLAEGIDIQQRTNLWHCALAVVRIRKNFFEWVQIGDCLILVIDQKNNFKLLVQDYDHDAEVLSLWKKLAQKKVKNIAEIIGKGPLLKVWEKANETYGILDGEENFLSFLNQGKESLKGLKHILLFTDGLLIPKENPKAQDDFDTLVKLYLKGGLLKVKDFVRKLEEKDPLCLKCPRYKQYDDIAAISISL